jgi:hypothetical protein
VKAIKPTILLLSVAQFAALIGHVVIDFLGDVMLAHDTYDDMNHSSRTVVALVTLGLALFGSGVGLRAAIREARGSENAFCVALRAALPRSVPGFVTAAVVLSTLILCIMETCDAWLAGYSVDDVGDLFGGSVSFGATIETVVALVISLLSLGGLRRLARTRIIAGALGALLRRCVHCVVGRETRVDIRLGLVFRVHYVCRRIAGRAPPLLILVSTR